MLLLSALAGSALPDDVEPGISHALSRYRAEALSDVRYKLTIEVKPGATAVDGTAEIRFGRKGKGALVLDFGGESYGDLRVNGHEAQDTAMAIHDHIVLPADLLVDGENVVTCRFRSTVAPTGTPLTVYRDPATQSEYFYTLVVPADAHRLFPCFDQPDLKGSFTLELDLPKEWKAVANGMEVGTKELDDSRSRTTFWPTKPISTYLFAFACGPFAVHEAAALPETLSHLKRPVRILYRPDRAEHVDLPTLEKMHHESLVWMQDYFGHDYPFEKLDFVLTPGFPYGGMEHPGAIFYRETALSFDHEPTVSELLRRSTLIYHEVSHQWFGNLVTMRWFDDLWLKEGFATFVGYRALEVLEPERNAWLRFHQRVKPSAYRVDSTAGTTPVYQPLGNLNDAKSNYGPIVYNKAPAILRELEARLGESKFQDGVQLFVQRHAFANATWQELIAALEEASQTFLGRWSGRWITAPGMPTVRVEWSADDQGNIDRFEVVQSHASDEDIWPVHVRIHLADKDGSSREHSLGLLNKRTRIKKLEGTPAPSWVVLNPRDVEYGQFLVDARSVTALLAHLPHEEDPLLRSTSFRALYETLREGEVDPRAFLETGLDLLEAETDPLTHSSILGPVGTVASRYVSQEEAPAYQGRLAKILIAQLESHTVPGQELGLFRRLAAMTTVEGIPELVIATLKGEKSFPGVHLGTRDRIGTVAGLLAIGHPDADKLLAQFEKEAEGDVSRALYIARAARPDAKVKEEYFATYLDKEEPPEQWVQGSLGNFHWRGQEALTLPYLRRALDQVEWVKEHRKIFFMPAWINSFINAHQTREALSIVQKFQGDNPDLSRDIQLKLLQSIDGLERAVRIRERWTPEGS